MSPEPQRVLLPLWAWFLTSELLGSYQNRVVTILCTYTTYIYSTTNNTVSTVSAVMADDTARATAVRVQNAEYTLDIAAPGHNSARRSDL